MRFILQQKRIISGITTYVFALFLCLAMISTARANVCFLPDDVDCAEGNTEGFWPGADSNPNACDSSFNSTSSRNACGEACEKCNDSNSPYYGLYKCPRPTCNCDGFNSTEPTNECGDSCERCTITGDRNYGKYKCPDVRRVCDDCEYTEEQAKLKMEQNSCFVCEPCNSNCCLGKWRCSEDRDCDWCKKNGYTSEIDVAAEQERNGECVNQRCEACPKDSNLFKCTPLSGQCNPSYYQYSSTLLSSYTQTQINNHCDEECGICFDPRYGYKHCTCFGYDKREADCTREGLIGLNPCNGHNGKWFEKCCSACSGYTYERDMSDTPGCSCTKCENACPDVTKKWKCICKEQCDSSFDKTSPETGDGWKCDKCSDVNGDHYKCVCKEGYILRNKSCVKPGDGCPEGTYDFALIKNDPFIVGEKCHGANVLMVKDEEDNIIKDEEGYPICWYCDELHDPEPTHGASVHCNLINQRDGTATDSDSGGSVHGVGDFMCRCSLPSDGSLSNIVVKSSGNNVVYSCGQGDTLIVDHMHVGDSCEFYGGGKMVGKSDMNSDGQGIHHWYCTYVKSTN